MPPDFFKRMISVCTNPEPHPDDSFFLWGKGFQYQLHLLGYFIPYSDAERNEISEQMQLILKTLTPKEERVVRMRFGIGADRDHTLEEVGRHLSITRERVRQIEAKALRKLKHPSKLRALKILLTS